jgi:TolB-like protein
VLTFAARRVERPLNIVPSIAVLPFTNLSPGRRTSIADGIRKEIINTLAQLPASGRPADVVVFVQGQDTRAGDVAARLRVAHVLTGSVRKAGTRLRITVQLVNAQDAVTVWSERYDRQTDDIFQIQDEIATAIAERLRVALAAGAGGPIAKRGTDNVEAYELYLKGRFLVNQRGAGIASGLECFERALAIDPGYRWRMRVSGSRWPSGSTAMRRPTKRAGHGARPRTPSPSMAPRRAACRAGIRELPTTGLGNCEREFQRAA